MGLRHATLKGRLIHVHGIHDRALKVAMQLMSGGSPMCNSAELLEILNYAVTKAMVELAEVKAEIERLNTKGEV